MGIWINAFEETHTRSSTSPCPVGAAPTTSSFSNYHLASMDWGKTTTRRDGKHLSFGIWCALYKMFNGNFCITKETWFLHEVPWISTQIESISNELDIIFMCLHHNRWTQQCDAWWRHQIKPFSALLALCEGNPPATVDSPHKGQWRGALTFSLICSWTNFWANNRDSRWFETPSCSLWRHCNSVTD